MKFVKKIGDGDVTIQNNEVIEKTPGEKANDWAQEFTSQPEVSHHPIVQHLSSVVVLQSNIFLICL